MLSRCSVVSDSLRPHRLQHTRLLCPSLSSRVCWDSCPLSQWCHSIISSSVTPFLLVPSVFPSISWGPSDYPSVHIKSYLPLSLSGVYLVAQMVKSLPAMRETWVRSLGWEDPLEVEMATHSNILARKIPWQRSLVGYSPWGHKESQLNDWHFLFLGPKTEPWTGFCTGWCGDSGSLSSAGSSWGALWCHGRQFDLAAGANGHHVALWCFSWNCLNDCE